MIYIDTETASELDLKKTGGIRYAESCVLLAVVWTDDTSDTVKLWECHRQPEMPEHLRDLLQTQELVAHNAMFDRHVLHHAAGVETELERWTCTAALARYAGLPGDLLHAGRALDVPGDLLKGDDSGGIDVFSKMSGPRYRHPSEDVERWQAFMRYAAQDVLACRELHRHLLDYLPPVLLRHWEHERRVYAWDQLVNDKGLPMDREMLASALEMARKLKPALASRMAELTGGAVTSLGSPKLLDYLRGEHALELDNLRRETREEVLLEPDLDPKARELLVLRGYHRTSTAKYARMRSMLSEDDRARGAFLYAGAHTRRWAGQGFQPQNLTRPAAGLNPPDVARHIRDCAGDYRKLRLLYEEEPSELLASGVRGAIKAASGKTLVIVDYSQVESRVLAKLSECKKKIAAFAEFDRLGSETLDPYQRTALEVLGDAGRRQEGKMMDLGLGFGMGPPRFAAASGLDERRAQQMVIAWRETYWEVCALWRTLHDALANRDRSWTFERRGTVWLRLPNGSALGYRGLRRATWGEVMLRARKAGRYEEELARFERATGRVYGPREHSTRSRQLVHQTRFGWQFLHGGLLTENLVQASARELLAHHALRIYRELMLVPVLHAHDELVFEVDARCAGRVLADVEHIMSEPPPWLEMPVKAVGHVSARYTK